MTAPIHQTPSPVIDLAIALEESKERERVLRDEVAELKKQSPETMRAYLTDLVRAMDGANISSWQTTAYWQTELDAAREYLATPDQTNEQ